MSSGLVSRISFLRDQISIQRAMTFLFLIWIWVWIWIYFFFFFAGVMHCIGIMKKVKLASCFEHIFGVVHPDLFRC